MNKITRKMALHKCPSFGWKFPLSLNKQLQQLTVMLLPYRFTSCILRHNKCALQKIQTRTKHIKRSECCCMCASSSESSGFLGDLQSCPPSPRKMQQNCKTKSHIIIHAHGLYNQTVKLLMEEILHYGCKNILENNIWIHRGKHGETTDELMQYFLHKLSIPPKQCPLTKEFLEEHVPRLWWVPQQNPSWHFVRMNLLDPIGLNKWP